MSALSSFYYWSFRYKLFSPPNPQVFKAIFNHKPPFIQVPDLDEQDTYTCTYNYGDVGSFKNIDVDIISKLQLKNYHAITLRQL